MVRFEHRTRSCVSAIRNGRTVLAALVVLLSLVALLGPSSAFGITRTEVIARAQSVMNDPMPYSQSRFTDGWRNDCSGYVSWAWKTGSNGYVTANMHDISSRIPKEQLQPGDVLLKASVGGAGGHVRMFYAWADDAHTTYVAYEQTPPRTWSSVIRIADDIAAGYIPYRYDKITDSPAPWYLGHNPGFNVWNKGSKSSDPSQAGWLPVWWAYGSTGAGTSWQIRGDVVSSPAFALGLTNSSASTFVEARQKIAVTPGKGYTLVANVQTTSKPEAVELYLQFFNASGGHLLTRGPIIGDKFSIGAAGFKTMSVTATAPAGTVRVDPVVGLRGAGKAVFDDVYFTVTAPLPVYRFFNPHTGAHFYTASAQECGVVVNTLADTFIFEGPAYNVVATTANSSPLYRFYNQRNGTHFYTASSAEAQQVKSTLASTYAYDGPVYNVCPKPIAGAVPVYRFFNKKNGSHFYTNSESEREYVTSKLGTTYTFEGPAFFLAQ